MNNVVIFKREVSKYTVIVFEQSVDCTGTYYYYIVIGTPTYSLLYEGH